MPARAIRKHLSRMLRRYYSITIEHTSRGRSISRPGSRKKTNEKKKKKNSSRGTKGTIKIDSSRRSSSFVVDHQLGRSCSTGSSRSDWRPMALVELATRCVWNLRRIALHARDASSRAYAASSLSQIINWIQLTIIDSQVLLVEKEKGKLYLG